MTVGNEELLTIDEMAAVLKVKKSFIYQLTRFGPKAIPFIKIGKHLRFNKNEVLKYFNEKNKA